MKLVYKTYGQTPNPKNAPAGYPAVCMELSDSEPIPAGFTETTKQDLEELKASMRSEYEAWASTQTSDEQ